MSTAQDNLVAWLRDAHAMEKQAETMLKAQYERIKNYPDLKARIGQHLEETRQQAKSLETCLNQIGGGSSTIKDMAGKITAFGQGLSGLFVSDEIIKGSLASYTFEHFEIASYRILIAAAEFAGDRQTKAVCEGILKEEIAMAKWLEDNLSGVTEAFLTRAEADITAKR
ncbi:ferritin-like metal-binding protein YciE [Rhizobium azibense]|nr:ferritin-like metal-binding protein YciE [Rhizobium azibense]